MRNWIRNISKVFFLIVAGVLLFLVYKQAFRESLVVEEQAVTVYEVSQEDIISSGQEIIIKSFDEIKNLKWINNEALYIEGVIDGHEDYYLFDTDKYELITYNRQKEEYVDYGDYTFVQDIPGVGSLCVKGTTIGLLSDGTYEVIAENATFEGELKYVLSKDLTKLLYYHHDKDILVTYNFQKDFYRSIDVDLTDQVMSNFEEVIQISPIGGYVSVEYRLDDLEETYFSIYGADSGRLYADQVFGAYLSWSDGDEYVCYYYTKESQALSNSFAGIDIESRRIGYFDVSKKDIKYLDSSQMDQSLISPLYWKDNTVSALIGDVADDIQIQGILSYDFDNHVFQVIGVEMPPIMASATVELMNMVDSYILYTQEEDKRQVHRIMKESHDVLVNEALMPFKVVGQEVFFYEDHGYLMTLDHEKLTVASDQFENYMFIEATVFDVVPNQDFSQIVVWLNNKSEIRIMRTN